MTPKERAAMQQALEALDYLSAVVQRQLTTKTKQEYSLDKSNEAITALREALKPNREGKYYYKDNACTADSADSHDCICWHDEALAEQAEQEPVAWMYTSKHTNDSTLEWYRVVTTFYDDHIETPLYAAPVRTKDLP